MEEAVFCEILVNWAGYVVFYALSVLNFLTDKGGGKVDEFVVHSLVSEFRKRRFVQVYLGRP